MDGASATAPEVQEAERRIAHVPLVLNRRNFNWLTQRISEVVEQPAPRWWWVIFADYCKRRNVWTFLYWLSDFHRRRHMGKSDPGRLGLGHHQLRFLDRYRTRRHTDLSDLVFASPKVAYVDQSFRRGDDAFCSYLRGDFPRHPRRPVLDGVVYGTDT